ncbi:hypothetical protein ACQP1O_42955 (plasmid) [Nocardia sp. CA-151230]|uniref:hypothetical protein n=1 Tax=Nocardia sp. CA-151230 TaxID=3239982 RepID=UPI003D8A55C5
MAYDRTGEPTDPTPVPPCGRPGCKGITGYDDEYRPIPCLVCRPHLRKTVNSNDISVVGSPSARAQAAIDRDNQENQ